MPQILHLNCSARMEGSFSRRLSGEFVAGWIAAHPDATLLRRDLVADALPPLSEVAVSGMFVPEEDKTPEMNAALGLSNLLVDELLASTHIVIATPMYNFHVPPALKNWFDHVARAGRTFQFSEQGPVGLAGGRKVLIISARGGNYAEDSPAHEFDLQTPWLRVILGFMGLIDVEVVRCESTNLGGELHEASLAAAEARLEKLVAAW